MVPLYIFANAESTPILIYFIYMSYLRSADTIGLVIFPLSPLPNLPLRPHPHTKTLKSLVTQHDYESPAEIMVTLHSARSMI